MFNINKYTMKKNEYTTFFAEVYNIDQEQGTEYLTFSVYVATDIDDHSPKYSYDKMRDRAYAMALAEKIHRDQKTNDLIILTA
jgi:hypothetical protein